MVDSAIGYQTTQQRATNKLLDEYTEQLRRANRLEDLSEKALARLAYLRDADPKLAVFCDDIESLLLLG